MDVVALIIAVLAIGFSVVAMRRTLPSAARERAATRASPSELPAAQASAATPTAPQQITVPDDLRLAVASSLRHVSVVRYDAFSDVTGLMSFTAAILDDNGDGFVITSLHSRSDSRTLLKGISGGTGEGLSPEEQQAVDYATGVDLP